MENCAENCVPVRKLRPTVRSERLRQRFLECFNAEPDFYVRVPGRVNLIGEHIDYCGYGVCPMALEQDILIAVGTSEPDRSLKIVNVDKERFSDHNCPIDNITIDVRGAPEWFQYFLCGVKGILEVLPADTKVRGFSVAVSGTIPESAGLSSSSALVSAAAVATAVVHKFSISKEGIANLCAACERYIGTQGGGMDQAIAFLATEGCAKLIDFAPLRSKDVPLPAGAVFVIAHSLTNLNKAATNDFNCRVVECRFAAQILAKKQGLKWNEIKKLQEVQNNLNLSLEAVIELVQCSFKEDPYTLEEIVQELDTDLRTINEVTLTPNTRNIERFKLKQRALHVYQEALRVEKFYKTCSNSPSLSGREAVLETLGGLMTQSHDSLRDLYECSNPQLDRLISLSRGVALGARLTGAGWGGCAVALVRSSDADAYVDMLAKEFYGELGVGEGLDRYVFKTEPNSGACIYTVD